MDNYYIKLKPEDLVGLLTNSDAMKGLIEQVLNQVLEAQMTEHLGAERYAHAEDRQGYRNGYRTRQLYTRVGSLTLLVPQTRDGSFSTEIFKRYQRSEQAFVLGLMEMYLQGIDPQSDEGDRRVMWRELFEINGESVMRRARCACTSVARSALRSLPLSISVVRCTGSGCASRSSGALYRGVDRVWHHSRGETRTFGPNGCQ